VHESGFGPEADVAVARADVGFRGRSRHQKSKLPLPSLTDCVEKVRVSTRSNLFSAAVRFSDADVRGLVIHARRNGDRSKSICGGNQRQSKMSLTFWQICQCSRLATFSTESTHQRHRPRGYDALHFDFKLIVQARRMSYPLRRAGHRDSFGLSRTS
jgi:hypothetical protein